MRYNILFSYLEMRTLIKNIERQSLSLHQLLRLCRAPNTFSRDIQDWFIRLRAIRHIYFIRFLCPKRFRIDYSFGSFQRSNSTVSGNYSAVTVPKRNNLSQIESYSGSTNRQVSGVPPPPPPMNVTYPIAMVAPVQHRGSVDGRLISFYLNFTHRN